MLVPSQLGRSHRRVGISALEMFTCLWCRSSRVASAKEAFCALSKLQSVILTPLNRTPSRNISHLVCTAALSLSLPYTAPSQFRPDQEPPAPRFQRHRPFPARTTTRSTLPATNGQGEVERTWRQQATTTACQHHASSPAHHGVRSSARARRARQRGFRDGDGAVTTSEALRLCPGSSLLRSPSHRVYNHSAIWKARLPRVPAPREPFPPHRLCATAV